MDYAACNLVYVDRTAGEDRLVKRGDALPSTVDSANVELGGQLPLSSEGERAHVNRNIGILLGIFSEVHVCTSGQACIIKLSELNESSNADSRPTLVLIDVPYDDSRRDSQLRSRWRTISPSTHQSDFSAPEAADASFYGLTLLQSIANDMQHQNLSGLVIPVAVVSIPQKETIKPVPSEEEDPTSPSDSQPAHTNHVSIGTASVAIPLDPRRTMRYLDIGAKDVLTSPLSPERVPSLAIHAYHAHKESLTRRRMSLDVKRGRKRSWVGVDELKPYAYLREAMVSGLMDGICRPFGDVSPVAPVHFSVPVSRREAIQRDIGAWNFSAHEFTDDELLQAGVFMLEHALQIPELEQWRMPTDNLTSFLVACRAAYNAFVPYHNFRHVIDVMQAVFHFLLEVAALPPYPPSRAPTPTQATAEEKKSPIAALIRPFDALALLITAIGHDVGHPGVNNAFLVTLNAPLAQLYNDRSVLESFHCAAYSQILRRHWPSAFSERQMRQLMISSILATDMGVHFDYMKRLGFLQEKLHENKGTDGWNGRLIEEYRTLACSLLIKCADISNVARRYDIAEQWTMILTDEFSRQAMMESDLGIPSALAAPPVREIVELGRSQLGFMNMFAIPLFQGVADVIPAMQYTVDELNKNKRTWEERIQEHQAKDRKDSDDSLTKDGTKSPRHMSLASPSRTHTPRTNNHSDINNSSSSASNSSRKRSIRPNDPLDFKFQSLADLPDVDAQPAPQEDEPPNGPLIPSAVSPENASRMTSDQLELSYATASAPGLLDHPSQAADVDIRDSAPNGISIGHSLVTDAVVKDQATGRPESTTNKDSRHHRSSETTEGSSNSNSMPGSNDWASQATSATTGKLPLSPSTQGTSITSNDSTEKTSPSQFARPPTGDSSLGATPGLANGVASSSAPVLGSQTSSSVSNEASCSSTTGGGDAKPPTPVAILDTVRGLTKKPSKSRFRMQFWKRKSAVPGVEGPPLPVAGAGQGLGLGHHLGHQARTHSHSAASPATANDSREGEGEGG